MGVPFRSYFGALVALQLGSLAGFVVVGSKSIPITKSTVANSNTIGNSRGHQVANKRFWDIGEREWRPIRRSKPCDRGRGQRGSSAKGGGGPWQFFSESELGAVGVGTGDLIDWIAGSWIFSDTSRTSWRRRHSPFTEGSEGSCSKAACRSQTEETCLWSGGEYWLNTMWVDPGCIMNGLWPSGFEMKPTMWW